MTNKSAFQGIERLYSEQGLAKLAGSHVMIIGLGGVGSWAAEALARSGVGRMTLVDLDDICVSNINRQIHATQDTVGKMKVQQMKERIMTINPRAEIHCVEDFFSASSMEEILSLPCDFIIDAIDGAKSKSLLIARCFEKKLPLIVTGGAGGKVDPTLIQEADLNHSYKCKLLFQVRKKLKQDFGFSRDKKNVYNIPCVFSPEEQIQPQARFRSHEAKKLDCQTGYGSSVFVTGAFGFVAAARVVKILTSTK